MSNSVVDTIAVAVTVGVFVWLALFAGKADAKEHLWGGYHGSCDWGFYNCTDDPTESKWGVGAAPLTSNCTFNEGAFGTNCTF